MLHSWLKTLLATILLTSFLELLLPESKLREFVKVVLGIFVIVTVMAPFTALKSEKISFERLLLQNTGQDYSRMLEADSEKLREVNGKLIEEQCSEDIDRQVRSLAMLVTGVADVKTEAELKENGRIEKLMIYLKTKSHFSDIEPVRLKERKATEHKDRVLINTVQQAVSNFYHLPKEQVLIALMD